MKRKKPGPARTGPQQSERTITRRDALKGALGLGAMAALSSCAYIEKDSGSVTKRSVLGQADLIRFENEKPGTRDWLLANTRIDRATKYRCPWIEGYCSRTSVGAGEPISVHVSTNPPSPFKLDIYRMGYYGGAGGRLMRAYEPFNGATQPDPPIGEKRFRDCQWEPCGKAAPADPGVPGKRASNGCLKANDPDNSMLHMRHEIVRTVDRPQRATMARPGRLARKEPLRTRRQTSSTQSGWPSARCQCSKPP